VYYIVSGAMVLSTFIFYLILIFLAKVILNLIKYIGWKESCFNSIPFSKKIDVARRDQATSWSTRCLYEGDGLSDRMATIRSTYVTFSGNAVWQVGARSAENQLHQKGSLQPQALRIPWSAVFARDRLGNSLTAARLKGQTIPGVYRRRL
jgi:hypothetical protein